MKSNDQSSPADIVRFYLEAGLDLPLQDEPVNRLAETRVFPVENARTKAAEPFAAINPVVDVSGANTLDELEAMIEGYNGCGLKKTATKMVFADGKAGSRVMLVGEAPGRDEELQGKPFAGKSGLLLDLMLKAIGLDRTNVYIANSVYWRTPGNRPPTPEECAQCLPFIQRQIELAKPEFVVLVGAVPARALLGTSDGIMQLRGHWTDLKVAGSIFLPTLPTLTPDYLLRNPAHKRLAWADWLSLKAKLKNT